MADLLWQIGDRQGKSLVDHVILSRGIENRDHFLNPKWPDDLHDPLLLPDMEVACERIWRAIINEETIGVIGDYDVDGTPGAALLKDFLSGLGVKVVVVLPNRQTGYGVKSEFIDKIISAGSQLVVTVDTGVRDVEAINYAKSKGIDCIITDHHECPEKLPEAMAVIDPKRVDSKYPFNELCGTGVAFKLVQALQKTESKYRTPEIKEGDVRWLLDLVAISTVADMMPLVDENRILVRFGLKVVNKTKRVGLQRLIEALKINGELTAENIGYNLAPKMNAMGRLETMEPILELLLTDDSVVADKIIKQVFGAHTQRKILVEKMLAQAVELVKPGDDVIIVAHNDWLPGLVGLAASRLSEMHGKVAICLAPDDGGDWRGSMRAPKGEDAMALITKTDQYLMSFGGHREAAGVTVAADQLESWRKAVQELAVSSLDRSVVASLNIDANIDAEEVTLDNALELAKCQPFGLGLTEPLWVITNYLPRGVFWLSDGKHCRFDIGSGAKAIYFGCEDQKELIESGEKIDLAGYLRTNEYKGNLSPQIMVKAIRKAA